MVHAFVPEHLLDLADYLNNHQFRSELYDLQCINRTVINRLYFASYLHAKEWILVHGEYDSLDDYTDESSSHLAIVVALRRLNQHNLSTDFFNFKELRKDADYDIVKIINDDDVKKAYEFANAIFSSLV
jgi:hypothetical protein